MQTPKPPVTHISVSFVRNTARIIHEDEEKKNAPPHFFFEKKTNHIDVLDKMIHKPIR